ncbi:TrmH family RNA methyltransferase [Fulvivirgaceae bacterium LMO-SS25]
MPAEQIIQSPKNPKIKNLELLIAKSRERKKQGLFVIEGRKECELAIKSNLALDSWYYYPDGLGKEEKALIPLLQQLNLPSYRLEKEAFEKIAYRSGTVGLILLAKSYEQKLSTLKLSKNPLILVVEGVEKPGNLGALLRTADAAQLDAVICCDQQTDLFNPNVIRSSLGCIFSVPTVQCSSEEAITWLSEKGIQLLVTDLEGAVSYLEVNYRKSSAIVMGTEATGITELWRKAADAKIKIPMLGLIDSLNVSTSAAIVAFEAKRQREVK